MKNSKFLSLLTAAALAVSSFSGLAMNGGVAHASGATKIIGTEAAPADGSLYISAYVNNESVAVGGVATFSITNGTAATAQLFITTVSPDSPNGTAINAGAAGAIAGTAGIAAWNPGVIAAGTTGTVTYTAAAGDIATGVYVVIDRDGDGSYNLGDRYFRINVFQGQPAVGYVIDGGVAATDAIMSNESTPANAVELRTSDFVKTISGADNKITYKVNNSAAPWPNPVQEAVVLPALTDPANMGGAQRDDVSALQIADAVVTDGKVIVTGKKAGTVRVLIGPKVEDGVVLGGNTAAYFDVTFNVSSLDGVLSLTESTAPTVDLDNDTFYWANNATDTKTFNIVQKDGTALGDFGITSLNDVQSWNVDYDLTNVTGTLELVYGSRNNVLSLTGEGPSVIVRHAAGATGVLTASIRATINGTVYYATKSVTIVSSTKIDTVFLNNGTTTRTFDGYLALNGEIDSYNTTSGRRITWSTTEGLDARKPIYFGGTSTVAATAIQGTTGKLTYTLDDTTYVRFSGQAGKSIVVNNISGGTNQNYIALVLTDAGAKTTTSRIGKLTVAFEYTAAVGGTNYAGSTSYDLYVNVPQDFSFELVDENNVAYKDTIEWLINDSVESTKYVKFMKVQSTSADINLGTTSTDYANTTVQWQLKSGNMNSFELGGYQAQNANVAGAVANTGVLAGAGKENRAVGPKGQTGVTDTLVVTVTVNRADGVHKSVREYSLVSNPVGLSVALDDYYPVGTDLDLSTIEVKYDGAAVDYNKVTWRIVDDPSQSVSLSANQKVLFMRAASKTKAKIGVTYITDKNNTAVTTKTVQVVNALKPSVSAIEVEEGKTYDLSGITATINATTTKSAITSFTSKDATVATISGTTLTGVKAGTTQVKITDADNGIGYIDVTVKSGTTPTPEPEIKPGDIVSEDGVVGVVAEDMTVIITDVAIVNKAITIPATVDGLTVSDIAPQAFKKAKATKLYVYGAVDEIGKGAFKNSSVKKAYFFEPEALKTVGKNAFAKTNAKVVGVAASFSEDAASQLKKAGASKVKNNGTAK